MPLDWQRWSEPEVHRALGACRGRLLLMFGERACGTCRAALTRIPPLVDRHVGALVYLDAGECGGLLREFDVFHLPALFLYLDGEYHAKLEAPLDDRLGSAIERAFAADPQEAP